MIAIATVLMFSLMTLVLGLLLAFVPYLMRKNECFAVTVPTAAQSDPRIISLKRRYRTTMVVVTLVLTLVAVAGGVCIVEGIEYSNTRTYLGIVLECIAVIGLALVSFALMLVFRKRIIAIKREEGWAAQHRIRTAIVDKEDTPRPISLAWNLLYLVVILFTIALGLTFYPSMPDLIPMHGDLAGNVDSYVEKSVASVFGFPLLIEVFLGLVFLACHAAIIRSKRPADPTAPTTSALAYGLYARAQSVLMLAIGIILSAAIGIGFILSSAAVITLGQTGVAIIILAVLVVIGSVALSLVYGQAGSRLFRRMQEDDFLLNDEDQHWKLGIIYVNRDDPSVFLPERFGFGWTINFARPAAWILLGCFLLLDLTLIIGVVVLT